MSPTRILTATQRESFEMSAVPLGLAATHLAQRDVVTLALHPPNVIPACVESSPRARLSWSAPGRLSWYPRMGGQVAVPPGHSWVL